MYAKREMLACFYELQAIEGVIFFSSPVFVYC